MKNDQKSQLEIENEPLKTIFLQPVCRLSPYHPSFPESRALRQHLADVEAAGRVAAEAATSKLEAYKRRAREWLRDASAAHEASREAAASARREPRLQCEWDTSSLSASCFCSTLETIVARCWIPFFALFRYWQTLLPPPWRTFECV